MGRVLNVFIVSFPEILDTAKGLKDLILKLSRRSGCVMSFRLGEWWIMDLEYL